jgi:hypothetical protein
LIEAHRLLGVRKAEGWRLDWKVDLQCLGFMAKNSRTLQKLREEVIMWNFLMTPLLITAGGRTAELPGKQVRSSREVLNEFLVVLFLTAGPVLGAAIFLTWLGGLLWGVLSSVL